MNVRVMSPRRMLRLRPSLTVAPLLAPCGRFEPSSFPTCVTAPELKE